LEGTKCKIRINGPKKNRLKGIDFGKRIWTTGRGSNLKKKDDEKGKNCLRGFDEKLTQERWKRSITFIEIFKERTQ
jgi:hypothetical protein